MAMVAGAGLGQILGGRKGLREAITGKRAA